MRRCFVIVGVVLLSAFAQSLSSQTAAEVRKIEALIAHVENMQEAVFIRNGSEYTCKEAAAHMRRKWQALADRVQTARDFITLAGSVSSQSGQPYMIRFKDGRTIPSGELLLGVLNKIEASEKR